MGIALEGAVLNEIGGWKESCGKEQGEEWEYFGFHVGDKGYWHSMILILRHLASVAITRAPFFRTIPPTSGNTTTHEALLIPRTGVSLFRHEADAFKLQIEQKIETANVQIAKLSEELKVLRSFKKTSARY